MFRFMGILILIHEPGMLPIVTYVLLPHVGIQKLEAVAGKSENEAAEVGRKPAVFVVESNHRIAPGLHEP